MSETKELKIRGKKYVIKRLGFVEGAETDDLLRKATNVAESQAIQVFYGTVSPKFESLDAVKVADRETILHLWFEIRKFQEVEPSFLSLLKKSPLPESQPSKTEQS
jgi:hypothetical protein